MEKKLKYFFNVSLCAYFLSHGLELIKVTKHSETKRNMFWFEQIPEMEDIVQKWKNDSDYHKYIASYKEIRRKMA